MIFIAILSIIALTFLLLFFCKIKRRMYNYDIKMDYDGFSFEHEFDLVKCKGEYFYNVDEKNLGSKFLEIKYTTNIIGKICTPYVILLHKDKENRHALEHGGRGKRYLNISSLEGGGSFLLKSRFCKVIAIKIVAYSIQDNIDKPSLIVAPHPDDNEIAAFSFFNRDNIYVNVTSGQYENKRFREHYQDHNLAKIKLGSLRSLDSIMTPFAFGMEKSKIYNLGYYCQSLKNMHSKKNVNLLLDDKCCFRKFNINDSISNDKFEHNWDSLVGDFISIFESHSVENVILPDPRIDSHEDHKYTALAIVEALMIKNIKNVNLLLYTNHFVDSEFYPFGKIHSPIDLPAIFDHKFTFDKIVSVQLTDSMMKDKHVALQMMHDLRDLQELRSGFSYLHNFFVFLKSLVHPDANYYDRAVRQNEIFYTTNINAFYCKSFKKRFFASIE